MNKEKRIKELEDWLENHKGEFIEGEVREKHDEWKKLTGKG